MIERLNITYPTLSSVELPDVLDDLVRNIEQMRNTQNQKVNELIDEVNRLREEVDAAGKS